MSHIVKNGINYTKLIGVGAISALLLVGCQKKDKEEEDKSKPPVSTKVTDKPESTVDIIPCDDSVALVNLTQTIRSSIGQQVQMQVRSFGERSNTPIDMDNVNGVVNSILVDVGSPVALRDGNTNGMQTCQANLSLTLPSEDIYRASGIYAELEGGTLQQRMQQQNLALNSNMIVDNTFTYVVGMQGGQTVAKIAGQPAVLDVISDMMAKSQLKVAVDNKRQAINAAAAKRRKAQQQTNNSAQRPNNQVARSPSAANPKPPATTNENTADDTVIDNNNQKSLSLPEVDSNGEIQAQSSVTNSRTVVDPNAPKPEPSKPASIEPSAAPKKAPTDSAKPKFTVPKDESIEMIIREEEGMY